MVRGRKRCGESLREVDKNVLLESIPGVSYKGHLF